jgi:hypothetical protein
MLWTETKGKNPYFINTVAYSDLITLIFFTAVGMRNIYVANIMEAIDEGSFLNYNKLKMPKKILVHDLKCHPNDRKIVAACSDSQIRV